MGSQRVRQDWATFTLTFSLLTELPGKLNPCLVPHEQAWAWLHHILGPLLGLLEALQQLALQPLGFPGGSDSKASTCNVGDLGLIPGSGRSLEEGNGNPLQSSCLPGRLQSTGSQRVGHD